MKIDIGLFTVFLWICICINIQGERSNGDCMVNAGSIDECVQWINTTCDNATFITDRSVYADDCPMFTIFWTAPYYNLTLLVESHLMKPYNLCVTPVGCTKAFRTTEDGQEVPIGWNSSSLDPVCFGTKRSDTPTMNFRFDAQHQTRCMRTFINFHCEF
jgi:hypothetical protein